ncbi:MAG: hypothetical protein RJA49_3130 [Actinomycetota bacterium]
MSLVLLAVTAALSPFSLIAVSIVLATQRGPRNGIAFICGWITAVMSVGVVVSIVGANVDLSESHSPRKWFLALELAVGVALVVLWAMHRFRPREQHAAVEKPAKPEPAWQRRVTTMGYPGAFVTGAAVQTWPVMIAAAADIARLDIGPGKSLAWMFLFAVSTTAGIVVLEVLAWRSPHSAAERLDRLRTYISNHRNSVINVLYLVAGLWLFFRGLLGLV